MDKRKNKNLKISFLTFLSEYFNLVLLVLMGFILFFGFIFIISPKRQAISDELKKINIDKNLEKEQLEDLQRKITLYKRGYSNIDESKIAQINKFLPDESRLGELMVQFEKFAQKRGLLLTGIIASERPANKKAAARGGVMSIIEKLPPGVGVVDIEFGVDGLTYESMKDLIEEIESDLRLMDIVSLGFAPGGTTLDLKIMTYYNK